MYHDEFCDEFQEWRKRNKVTMRKVSKALRTPVSTLNAWLLGYNPIPSHMKEALEAFRKGHDF